MHHLCTSAICLVVCVCCFAVTADICNLETWQVVWKRSFGYEHEIHLFLTACLFVGFIFYFLLVFI